MRTIPRHLLRPIAGASAASLALLLLASAAWAADDGDDWPCYQKDARRSAATAAKLAFPLAAAWTHQGLAPRVAWTEPGRTVNMFDFDYCFQPVIAGGRLYFASSADDTVYCLDAADGAQRWTFTTAAPVRFAPHIADGRCHLASDDGTVYCLDAASGALLWRYRAVGKERMVSGNGRMISRWPCRSGVLVLDGVVYGSAGMWPSEGVFLFALDAKTGKELWCNDTTNAMYLAYPHDGLSFGGPTPQGYLLSDGKVLMVPTGQSAPAGFELASGRLRYWNQIANGSTWACIGEGWTMVAARGWQGDQDPRLGEAMLQPQDGISFLQLGDGRNEYGKWASYEKIAEPKRTERLRGMINPVCGRDRVVAAGGRYYFSGAGVVECIDPSGKDVARVWKLACPRVYSLALAKDALIVGGDREVFAVDAGTGAPLWRSAVPGQARGLAIAGGRLCVATDRGTMLMFAAGGGRPAAPVAGEKPGAVEARAAAPALPKGLAIDPALKGFALVAGCSDTALAVAIAENSQLDVICLLKGGEAVSAARRQLLGRAHGQGVTVHEVRTDGMLPYADFAANLVVVAGESGVQPHELYRVLHPCGGVLRFVGMPAAQATALARQAGAPQAEIADGDGGVAITRAGLEGAFDWNSPGDLDQRVKWPLELLWFGGPGKDRMLSRHAKGYPPPVPASGRVFIQGKGHVIAVDAYNGTELWDWNTPDYKSFAADDRFLYLTTGHGAVLQCDAQNGRIGKVYGKAQPIVYALDQPRTFDCRKKGAYAGRIAVARTASDLEITLESSSPAPSSCDYWRLYVDVRAPKERLLPTGRGKFPVFVNCVNGVFMRYDLSTDTVLPEMSLARRAPGDKAVVVRIPLAQLALLAGRTPDSLDLGAELTLFEDGRESPRECLDDFPLTNGTDLLQNGTATFALGAAKDPAASPIAALEHGDPAQLPAYAHDWGRVPLHKYHDGNIPLPPLATSKSLKIRDRLNLLTEDPGPVDYLRGYGCSGTISSAFMDFFRSGTFGMYDMADDSGMRNFPGVKPGCRITIAPALGVVVSAEGTADCFCPYNFATTMALGPAPERSNEDWSLFYGKIKPAPIERIALNFGAPGDRRDSAGTEWFGYPRQGSMFFTGGAAGPEPHTIDLPLTMEQLEGGRTVRINAERLPIEGTKEPWIFASAITKVRKLSIDLVYYQVRSSCLLFPTAKPPAIDGVLDEATWAEDAGLETVPRAKGKNPAAPRPPGRVKLRYDADSLYLAYQQDGPVAAGTVTGAQADIWKDECFDVALKHADYPWCSQFGIAAGGGRYSAERASLLRVPKVAGIAVDGKADDWGTQGLTLALPEGKGSVRLGWTPAGLLVLTTLPRDFSPTERANTALRSEYIDLDAAQLIETVVDAASQTADAKLVVVDPKRSAGQNREFETFKNANPLTLEQGLTKDGAAVVTEVLVPLARLGLKVEPGTRFGFKQVAFNPAAKDANIAAGYGMRRAVFNDGLMMGIVLVDAPAGPPALKAAAPRREFYGALLSWAVPEDASPIEGWKGAAKVDAKGFTAELAIPIRVLAAHGVALDRVEALFRNQAKMPLDMEALDREFTQAYRLTAPKVNPKPRPYTVKLCFAELMDVQPGERVFDIRIQGRTVAEGVDIAKRAGGIHRAHIETFPGIVADKVMDIELVPRNAQGDERALPLISGLEIAADP
jgi:outer membrane protein assembly factor BamB